MIKRQTKGELQLFYTNLTVFHVDKTVLLGCLSRLSELRSQREFFVTG